MYRVQYLCPRQSPYWRDLTAGLIWKTPREFPTFPSAQSACNGLLWQYHSARVIDPMGSVVYQI
jgi:hypothetical protein